MHVPAGSRWGRLVRRFHPEGIPWPGAVLYSSLSGSGIFRRHYELVAEDVRRYGPLSSVLDVGTGPGRLLLALRQTLPAARLTGVDISAPMIDRAQRIMKQHGQAGRIEVRVADAGGLPFDDESFDCVVSTGSLHHWKQPEAGLAEVYRVLRPGGHALLYDLVRHMPERAATEIREQFGRFRFTLLWLHSFEEPFLDPREMEVLGRRSAFTFEGTKFVGALCCLVLLKPLPGSLISPAR